MVHPGNSLPASGVSLPALTPQNFEADLSALINRYGEKCTDNQIITSLERALDEALVIAGDPEATKVRADLMEALRPFAECARHDIGETEDDADTFRNSAHNRAPKITVGDFRRALAVVAKAEAHQ